METFVVQFWLVFPLSCILEFSFLISTCVWFHIRRVSAFEPLSSLCPRYPTFSRFCLHWFGKEHSSCCVCFWQILKVEETRKGGEEFDRSRKWWCGRQEQDSGMLNYHRTGIPPSSQQTILIWFGMMVSLQIECNSAFQWGLLSDCLQLSVLASQKEGYTGRISPP
jgi:hypothetical protein